uniref:Skp1-related protein n=1 Tax=Ditylenchus dipsaci TaxID=166011 RepID=A0A915ED00_9BILA
MIKIQLKANDSEIFEVECNVIRLSSTLNDILNIRDLKLDAGGSDMLSEPTELDKVDGPTLGKVIEWCKYHVNDPLQTVKNTEMDEPRTDDIPAWDVEFLKGDQGMLFKLILAADYLGVRGLLDSTCKTVANMIKGKKPEEIRYMFNIENDFTPDEEAKIRAENGWVED